MIGPVTSAIETPQNAGPLEHASADFYEVVNPPGTGKTPHAGSPLRQVHQRAVGKSSATVRGIDFGGVRLDLPSSKNRVELVLVPLEQHLRVCVFDLLARAAPRAGGAILRPSRRAPQRRTHLGRDLRRDSRVSTQEANGREVASGDETGAERSTESRAVLAARSH